MTYEICFKHPEHGSDEIGCTYKTLEAAQSDIPVLQSNPGSIGASEWLKDATLWIVDEKGQIVS